MRFDPNNSRPTVGAQASRQQGLTALGLVLCAATLSLGAASLCAQNPDVVITAQDEWSNAFGDSESKLHYEVASRAELAGVLRWSHAANGRTISSGELPADVAAGGTANVVIPVRFPDVKKGVIFATELTVSVAARGSQQAVAEATKRIWIFPRDPFSGRTRWLDELEITLFDPAGDTADVLLSAAVPFTRTRNLATLTELDSGMLIIGEAVSLEKHRSLAESLVSAAARGLPVLCLAPSDGRFPLPNDDDAKTIPHSMVFRQSDVIAALDKRFDTRQWLPGSEPVTSRLGHRSYRNQLVLEVSHGPSGWPWWETRFGGRGGQQRGALIVCGFGLMKHWHEGPTPRFLLARLFEHLTENPPHTRSQPNDGE